MSYELRVKWNCIHMVNKRSFLQKSGRVFSLLNPVVD